MAPQEDNVVGTVQLTRSTSLVFSARPYKGKHLAHVRKYVSTAKYKGPTKAGLAMAGDVLLEVIEALEHLHAAVPGPKGLEFARVAKRGDVEIVISTVPPDDLKALPSVDVREFVDSTRYTGPTKKGIRFGWEKLPEVIHMLRAQAKKLGAKASKQSTLFQGAHPKWVDRAKEAGSSPPTAEDSVVSDLLPNGPKDFPEEFVKARVPCQPKMALPPEPVRVGQDPEGKYVVTSDFGFSVAVRNATEGNFIVYAQLRGKKDVRIPEEMIEVFRAVKAYENYVRDLQHSLVQAYLRKTGHRPMAEHQAQQAFREFGLPWL